MIGDGKGNQYENEFEYTLAQLNGQKPIINDLGTEDSDAQQFLKDNPGGWTDDNIFKFQLQQVPKARERKDEEDNMYKMSPNQLREKMQKGDAGNIQLAQNTTTMSDVVPDAKMTTEHYQLLQKGLSKLKTEMGAGKHTDNFIWLDNWLSKHIDQAVPRSDIQKGDKISKIGEVYENNPEGDISGVPNALTRELLPDITVRDLTRYDKYIPDAPMSDNIEDVRGEKDPNDSIIKPEVYDAYSRLNSETQKFKEDVNPQTDLKYQRSIMLRKK